MATIEELRERDRRYLENSGRVIPEGLLPRPPVTLYVYGDHDADDPPDTVVLRVTNGGHGKDVFWVTADGELHFGPQAHVILRGDHPRDNEYNAPLPDPRLSIGPQQNFSLKTATGIVFVRNQSEHLVLLELEGTPPLDPSDTPPVWPMTPYGVVGPETSLQVRGQGLYSADVPSEACQGESVTVGPDTAFPFKPVPEAEIVVVQPHEQANPVPCELRECLHAHRNASGTMCLDCGKIWL